MFPREVGSRTTKACRCHLFLLGHRFRPEKGLQHFQTLLETVIARNPSPSPTFTPRPAGAPGSSISPIGLGLGTNGSQRKRGWPGHGKGWPTPNAGGPGSCHPAASPRGPPVGLGVGGSPSCPPDCAKVGTRATIPTLPVLRVTQSIVRAGMFGLKSGGPKPPVGKRGGAPSRHNPS